MCYFQEDRPRYGAPVGRGRGMGVIKTQVTSVADARTLIEQGEGNTKLTQCVRMSRGRERLRDPYVGL